LIRRFFCALTAVFLLGSGAFAQDIGDIIRLHIVAADDSEAAQNLKLELRDVCLRCADICLADAPDTDAAYMRLESHLNDFLAACKSRAEQLGSGEVITAQIGRFDFPDRIYGSVLVPAGEYRALRITIGEGSGHNWWCVLYPNLCMIDEVQAASGKPSPDAVLRWLRSRIGG